MTKILFFVFFIIPFFVWSSTTELERIFNATKNQDYYKASQIVNELEESTIKSQLHSLISVISEKNVSRLNVNIYDETEDKYLRFINFLLAGYQSHFDSKQDNLSAYKSFSSAIRHSEELGNITFKKAALIGMLDLFSNEIFIGGKQFEPYLERFIELKTDRTDEVLIVIYKLIFLTKAGEDVDRIDTQYYNYYDKLDSLLTKFPKSHSFFSRYYYEKGIYHRIEGDYEKSEQFFLKADSLSSENRYSKNFRGGIAWQLSLLNMQNDHLDRAKKFLRIANQRLGKLRNKFYNDRLASLIFQKEGNYDSAYHYLRKSVDIEYELGYKNNTLESSILTVQNQTDKLKLDKLELESSNNRFRNWAILLGMLFILGSVIGVLAQKNTKRKQLLAEQEKNLEQQKVSNLIKEQELVAIDAMIEGQEKERQRVANELHDDLGSLMAAVKLQFNSLEAADEKGNLETFAITESLIDEAYGKIRAIAHAKNSGLIAKQGLLQAVKQMAEKVSIASGVSILVHDHGLDTRLENTMELMLFRIIQELMTNVIKHAAASEMNVHITNHGDTLNILVEDNGKGMALGENRVDNTGMGLKSIDKRIDNLHGTMDIESELGKGTVIILDIPI